MKRPRRKFWLVAQEIVAEGRGLALRNRASGREDMKMIVCFGSPPLNFGSPPLNEAPVPWVQVSPPFQRLGPYVVGTSGRIIGLYALRWFKPRRKGRLEDFVSVQEVPVVQTPSFGRPT